MSTSSRRCPTCQGERTEWRWGGDTYLMCSFCNTTDPVYGYVTLDCRDGQHAACSICDCDCHHTPKEPDARVR